MVESTISVLNNQVRRDILVFLKSGKKSAGEISGQFKLSNSTISHHLSRLKRADLIREYREKNYIFYELNTSVLDEITLWFMQFRKDDENE